MLVCAAKKESEVITVSNIITDSTGIADDFFDCEQSVSLAVIPPNKETVQIDVLQYLSNSDHSIESLSKYHSVNKDFLIYNNLLSSAWSKDYLASQVTSTRQVEIHCQINSLKPF